MIDAELGLLEERILREASDEFWRYTSQAASIGHGSLIDHASRLSGLSVNALTKLATIHWLLSEEVADFLTALPATLARLARTTTSITSTGPEVRGGIDWADTISVRARTGWTTPVFSYSEAQAESDTPPNRVLKGVLSQIHSAASFVGAKPLEVDDQATADRWLREVERRATLARRALRHPGLAPVRAPDQLGEHELRSAASHSARGYRRAVDAARLYRRLVDRRETAAIGEMLRRRVFVPAQRFRLFEIWILARVAAYFRGAGLQETHVPLFGDVQSTPVYRFAREGIAPIDVYFQGTPVVMKRDSAYKAVFESYDLDIGARTPDIVVQRGARADSPRVIIEAKASDDPKYVTDGVYKLLGYGADFATALIEPTLPFGLLVTKTIPRLHEGSDRSNHGVWIANVDSLDESLQGVLSRFIAD